MSFRIDTKAFVRQVDMILEALDTATIKIVTDSANLVAAKAKSEFAGQHPRGTPKTVLDRPQSISGNLKNSIHLVGTPTNIRAGVWSAKVAPTMIYGRRIELGFRGTDSLGRNYNQRAYPYMEPALRKANDLVQAIAEGAWAEALRI